MSKNRPIPYFRGVVFKGAYPGVDDCPSSAAIPVVAFTGRSNSGKSSLLSSLCDHANLARTSRTAGKTRTLNYFLVPPGEVPGPGLYLVDMPGFGFANLSKQEAAALRQMADRFLLEAENMALIVVVLDARREIGSEESNIIKFAAAENIPLVLARTKWDMLNAGERSAARKKWKNENIDKICISVSNADRTGIAELLEMIRGELHERL